MRNLKTFGHVLMAGTAALALSACDGASSVASPGEGTVVIPAPAPAPTPTPTGTPTPAPGTPAASCPTGTNDGGIVGNYRACRLPALLTGNVTLARLAGVAYEINGRVDVGVDAGGTGTGSTQTGILTIQPGVVLYANTTNTDNDFLIVNRGSRIAAEGTETQPIIFTAQQNLTGGVTDESQGLWGGVILAGRAPISNCNLAGVAGGAVNCENVVEGTGNALYGGATPTDTSGTFRYVQIRYSGTIISPNNELQGLTLGGVGSGTTIDHVQVHNSSDDGIEVFGGRVNMRYLAITGADDDGLDTDVGWQGFVQFVIAAQKPNNTQTDNYSTEIDSNNAEDALPRQNYRLANFTFIDTSTATNAAVRIRGGADVTMVNGIIQSNTPCLNIVAGETSATDKSTIRPANAALQDNGPPVFNSVFFACTGALSTTTAVNGITVTTAEQDALVAAGSNNTPGGTAANALQNGYFPTATTLAVTPFNAATLNPSGTSFFVQTAFIGAVSGPNDTNFRGWTCNSNRANFGTTSGACTGLPS
ncbi:hypothetical protein SAMN06297144_2058 [Sphingomonas guangdongensis]|uniref:Lipoprotein n=1 Tax=Sphingomonas guangdongensis TaxID=1141890 RepID=A0A285QYA2_9SPHN|nr:hypothetical protein [Sphingomonas guangdongensis]SOB86940.1 hypothetical protein SAMN06297144_2058 [Sphingomonas guangdongensis]